MKCPSKRRNTNTNTNTLRSKRPDGSRSARSTAKRFSSNVRRWQNFRLITTTNEHWFACERKKRRMPIRATYLYLWFRCVDVRFLLVKRILNDSLGRRRRFGEFQTDRRHRPLKGIAEYSVAHYQFHVIISALIIEIRSRRSDRLKRC